jgi:drug/metabolite transporter (DMT)-like permease
MTNALIYLSLFFMLICFLGASFGFNLRKRRNWIFILLGFMGGVLLGLSQRDFKSGVMIGVLVAVFSMAAASFRYYLRNRDKDE